MKSNYWIRLTVMFVLVLSPVSVVSAGSIWAKKGDTSVAQYTDDVASKIGDILTIKISEASAVNNKVQRDLKKETTKSNTFNGDLDIVTDNHDLIPRMPGLTMGADSTNELKGQSDYKDTRSFVDSMTVVVQDVQPNGNLVIMGRRERDIAGDMQLIEVSGLVRRSDIAFDNTIKSEQVANFYLSTTLKGVSKTYNKQGWLGSLFDILWPF
ncbi:MAG: flagellar basal body L-ring protein FlgH [Phycisphaerae bacterium]|nr:flagellar basal body L-ring protein FlgH [Phycisphaerae bacterium]